jgi:hypothetical protein
MKLISIDYLRWKDQVRYRVEEKYNVKADFHIEKSWFIYSGIKKMFI